MKEKYSKKYYTQITPNINSCSNKGDVKVEIQNKHSCEITFAANPFE